MESPKKTILVSYNAFKKYMPAWFYYPYVIQYTVSKMYWKILVSIFNSERRLTPYGKDLCLSHVQSIVKTFV